MNLYEIKFWKPESQCLAGELPSMWAYVVAQSAMDALASVLIISPGYEVVRLTWMTRTPDVSPLPWMAPAV